MKTRLTSVLLPLFLFPLLAFSQLPPNIDSLKQQIPVLQDSLYTRNLMYIAQYHFMYLEVDSAKHYLDRAQEALDAQPFPHLQIGAWDMRGILASFEQDYAESLFWLSKARKAWKKRGDKAGESSTCTNLGRTYAQLNDYGKALEMHQRTLVLNRELNDQRGVFLSIHNMSTVYSMTGDRKTGIYYKLKALQSSDFKPDPIDKIPVLMGLCSDYRELQKFDSAIYFGQAGLALARKIGHTGFEVRLLQSLAFTENERKDFNQAHQYLNEFSRLLDTSNYTLAGSYHNLRANAFWGLGQQELAFEHAFEALSYAEKLDEWIAYNNAYHQLYEFYNTTGPTDKALLYYEKNLEAEDSLFQQEKLLEIQRLKVAFSTQEKENEIRLLQAENAQQTQQIQQNTFQIGVILLGLVAMLVIGVLVFRNRMLKEQFQKSLTEQRLLRTQMNPHFFFHALGTIQQYILQEKDPKESLSYLSKFARLMRNTLESSQVELITLQEEIETLENYIQLQQLRYSFSFNYHIAIDRNLDPKACSIPPLLLQPVVENAIEHGLVKKKEAGKLTLNFHKYPEKLEITVEDNGIGRPAFPKNGMQHKSLATRLIMERLELLRKNLNQEASLNIIDLKNTQGLPLGTRVIFHLPLGLSQ